MQLSSVGSRADDHQVTPAERKIGRAPVTLACATCGDTFRVAATREHSAKFCSIPCRDAAGRATAVCQHCGKESTLKKGRAEVTLFCSRTCMFAAWGCAWCSKLIPDERRATGQHTCSNRCDTGLRLEAEQRSTGVLRAWCAGCKNIQDAGDFHKERANRNGLANRCKACLKAKYAATKIDYRRRRFAHEAAAPHRTVPFTQAQQDARWSMWGGRCWVCGIADATEEDHVKPLTEGGWHCLANLRPACKHCNASKQGRWPLPPERLGANFRHPAPRAGSDADERSPRLPRQEHTCEHCGALRVIRAHAARVMRFCSTACKDAAQKRPEVTVTCQGCGNVFTLPGHEASKQRKFCSTTCAYTSGKRGKGGRRKSQPGSGQDALF